MKEFKMGLRSEEEMLESIMPDVWGFHIMHLNPPYTVFAWQLVLYNQFGNVVYQQSRWMQIFADTSSSLQVDM